MVKELAMIILLKGTGVKVSEHLHQNEVDCNCQAEICTRTMVAESTIKSFEKTREEFGQPIMVNSFFRCQHWNNHYAVKGSKKSYHMIGHAIDIRPRDRDDLDLLDSIARKNFDVVIKYRHFIHCHNEHDSTELPLCIE